LNEKYSVFKFYEPLGRITPSIQALFSYDYGLSGNSPSIENGKKALRTTYN
jgi:hypothetical protein